MISWFDIAYAVLGALVVFYCFKNYFSSRKKPFLLCGLGFTCLIISDLMWVFAVFPWLNGILVVYGYIRFGLYTAFILLVVRALQLFSSENSKHHS